MSRPRLLPRSLAGQMVTVLLAAVILIHLGSMTVYRVAAVDMSDATWARQLAERLAGAVRRTLDQPTTARDSAAHALSSADLSLHWDARPMIAAPVHADARLDALRQRVARALHDMAASDSPLWLDYAEPPAAGHRHIILGTLPLRDGSYLNIRIPLLADTPPLLHTALLSTTLMAAGIAVVAILLVRMLTAPLSTVARAADAIGRGPGVIVAERGPAEVRRVAAAFNAMQARIERTLLDRTQALAAVSHDLRTPITRLRLRAGFVADATIQRDMDADLDEMEAMVDATLAYFRGDADPEAPRVLDLATLLITLVDDAQDAGRDAAYDGPRRADAVLRPLATKRAFSNLLDNAITYGGRARISLSEAGLPYDGASLRVVIDDDGPGIPPADLDRVFRPFERLHTSRNLRTGGVGLGLAIARQVILAQGGTITLHTRAAGGLRVEVALPRPYPTPATEKEVP